MATVPVPAPAIAALQARAMRLAQAEASYADCLAGVTLALGVDPSRVLGFDDERNVLLLKDEPADSGDEGSAPPPGMAPVAGHPESTTAD